MGAKIFSTDGRKVKMPAGEHLAPVVPGGVYILRHGLVCGEHAACGGVEVRGTQFRG